MGGGSNNYVLTKSLAKYFHSRYGLKNLVCERCGGVLKSGDEVHSQKRHRFGHTFHVRYHMACWEKLFFLYFFMIGKYAWIFRCCLRSLGVLSVMVLTLCPMTKKCQK